MTNPPQDCWTAMPNSLYQRIPELGLAAYGICSTVIRHTAGWHKQEDRISLSQFCEELGITKNTALTAIKVALAAGAISRRAATEGGYYYSYVEPSTSASAKIELVDQQGQQEQEAGAAPASANIELVDVLTSSEIELAELQGGAKIALGGVQKLNTQKKDQIKDITSNDVIHVSAETPPATDKKPNRRSNPLDDSKSPESVRNELARICNVDLKHAPKEVVISLYRSAKGIWAMQQERSKTEQQTVKAISMVVEYVQTNCHPYNSATPQPITPSAIHKHWDNARIAAGAKSHEAGSRKPTTSAEQRLRDAEAGKQANLAALTATGSSTNRVQFTEATADW